MSGEEAEKVVDRPDGPQTVPKRRMPKSKKRPRPDARRQASSARLGGPAISLRTAGNGLLERRKGILVSDCLHCDIHEMLDVHLQNNQADLGEIAARVTEVLADLILMAPPAEQAMLLAAVVANLGGMVLEKNQEADPDNPRR
jgi:hypothetical protein